MSKPTALTLPMQQLPPPLARCARLSLVCFLLAVALRGMGAERQFLHHHVPPAVTNAALVSRRSASTPLNLAIGLPVRNADALTNLLSQLYDRTSTNYRRFLTPQEFAQRFGPTKEDYQAVAQFARAHHLAVAGQHANRTVLEVSGTVADVEKAFHVTLNNYRHPTEPRTFFSADVEPSLELAVPLLSVSGLNDFVIPRPCFKPVSTGQVQPQLTGSGPSGYFLGFDFRRAYVPGSLLTGLGQSVALVEFDGFFPNDVVAYKNLAGLPDVPVKTILLNGFNGSPGNANIEVSLDIDMAIAMAPGLSQVLVYEGTTGNTVLNRIATDSIARQISASWTYPIDATTIQIFQQFAAQGQSFYNSSGDSGAYTGSPATPTDNPFVISVGGTDLTTTSGGGAWVSETTWSFSGGGYSTIFPIPTWQQGLNMATNQGSTTFRNLPDVAMVADNCYLIANNGQGLAVAGTSISAPLWAGFTALINQLAVTNGEPVVGFINPAVYAIGKGSNALSYTSLFHDITSGVNRTATSGTKFAAVPGYDLCTGWGTPTGDKLITALALTEPLRITPIAVPVLTGPVGGPFNPAPAVYTLTNGGTTAFNWGMGSAASWLSFAPTSGTLTPGGPATIVTPSVTAASSSLAAGSYPATVRFTNLNDGFVQTRQVTLAVVTLPVIVSQPGDQPVLIGSAANFSVGTLSNALLFYQWQFNGTNLADGGKITGSASASLLVSNVTAANAGSYSVVVSNAAGTAVSSNALLSIVPSAPVIVTQPTNTAVLPGAPAAFNVAAIGDTPYFYQWQFNGTNLTNDANVAGVTNFTLSINRVTSSNTGVYSVIVSNSLGFTTSAGAVLSIIPITAPGVALSSLWSFAGGNSGQSLYSPLTRGPDGSLYGTTLQGGSRNYGTVFKLSTNGSVTVLLSFNFVNGAFPYAGLVLGSDGFLYGTTYEGGVYGYGTVFKITTSGALTTLVSFNGQNGFFPVATLVQGTDGNFYGTTLEGEAYGFGSVFKMTPSGALTTLVAFDIADGEFPSCVLARGADGDFYGTTESGGATGSGTIFKVSPSGEFTSLYSFTGGNDGGVPIPGLILGNDGNFYGNTSGGGSGNAGTIFKFTPSGTLTTLYAFTNGIDGATPWGGLMQAADGNLYGTAQQGGAYAQGTAFRLTPSGPLVPLVQFNGYIGANPSAALIQTPDGGLYGTTLAGGPAGDGTLYRLDLSGPLQITEQPADQTAYAGATAMFTVATFGGGPVSYRWQQNGMDLTDGGDIFGAATTTLRIANVSVDDAAFYSVVASNSMSSVVSGEAILSVVFSPPHITRRPASLTRVVGTSAAFSVAAEGDLPLSYQWKWNGTNLMDGPNISGSTSDTLTISNVTLATSGNYSVFVSNSLHSVSSVQAALAVVPPTAPGALHSVLYQFTGGNDGAFPYAGVIQAKDGNLYGDTLEGGNIFLGTVFRMTLSNSLLTTLYSFSAGSDGAEPYGPLLQLTNGNFLGTTFQAGNHGFGTIFQMTPAGSVSPVWSFYGLNDGAEPFSGLALGKDGRPYGTSLFGGAAGFGSAFRLNADNTVTGAYQFTGGNDGAYPYAGLLLGKDGLLYGTALQGGAFNHGTVYRLNANGTLTTLAAFNGTNGDFPQAGLLQSADGSFYGATFQGGTNGFGAIFNVTTNGAFTNLVEFNYTNGANPAGALILGTDGNLYGTTSAGGPGGQGSVFKLTTNGILTTLLWFDGLNGADPQGTLLQATNGNFYGTTALGGLGFNPTYGAGFGTVFQLIVPIFITNSITAAPAIGALPYSANIAASAVAPPGDTLSFAKVSGPVWLAVSPSGALSGTPPNSSIGTNFFVVSLTDTNGVSATTTLKIVVNQDPPPSFVANPFELPPANVGQEYSGTIATNAYNLESTNGDVLTFAKVSGPAWLNIASDGTLSDGPQTADGGTNVFVVSVANLGTLSNTATMYLYVNSPPVFTNQTFNKPAATVGLPYSGTVATNVADPDLSAGDVLTFYKVAGPAWLSVAANGAISGTPAAGDLGANGFLLLVVDSGSLAGIGIMNLTVTADHPPLFTSNPFTEPHVNANQLYAATMATNATDPDLGDTLTFSKVSGPAWLSVATNGLLSGLPATPEAGTNAFTVRVTDVAGMSNQASMFINVGAPIQAQISWGGGQMSLLWTGGFPPYQVLTRTDLVRGAWATLGGPTSSNQMLLSPSNPASWFRLQGQ